MRAHIIASNFLNPISSEDFTPERWFEEKHPNTQQFTLSESSYLNNKTLSDEESYVINRVNEKKFVGNDLEKPRIFIKRIEVR